MIYKVLFVLSGVSLAIGLMKFGFHPPTIMIFKQYTTNQGLIYVMIGLVLYAITSFILNRI